MKTRSDRQASWRCIDRSANGPDTALPDTEATMQVRNVVEITRRNGRVPARLIEVSYRASQHGLIVLVLRNVAPQTINSVLDPIVPTLPIDIPGVLYIDVGDEARVRKAVLAAELIFVSTAPFRSLVQALGVTPQAVLPASRMFAHPADAFQWVQGLPGKETVPFRAKDQMDARMQP